MFTETPPLAIAIAIDIDIYIYIYIVLALIAVVRPIPASENDDQWFVPPQEYHDRSI